MFNFTPFEKVQLCSHFVSHFVQVKVVIVGQDPYFNPGQGEGLCFSVKKGVTIPPSLNRIYKVIAATVPGFKIPKHGSLEAWAKQGILMINATYVLPKLEANNKNGKQQTKIKNKNFSSVVQSFIHYFLG